jgi:UPF0755 protein
MTSSTDNKGFIRTFVIIGGALIALSISALLAYRFLLPPASFPTPYTASIEPGQPLVSISAELKEDGVIRSRQLFEMLIITFGGDKNISHGDYYFEKPVTVVELALRIAGREFGVDRTRVTIPEGFTNKQIAARLGQELSNFDTELFMTLAKDQEGYLFPDTYIFFPWTTPEAVVTTLRKTFDTKTASLQSDITASKRSFEDIMVMASLIEKEARGDNDRELIAGILWKRIDTGMLLQVDAPFLYVLGKESSELTRSDLAIDSPFNTYRYKGLPPSPIGNPGLASIKAALNPKASPYLYYLHDKDGTIYYARTYTEHLENIRKYLR